MANGEEYFLRGVDFKYDAKISITKVKYFWLFKSAGHNRSDTSVLAIIDKRNFF